MPAPKLTFFVELPSPELQKLFAAPEVAGFLRDGGYALSMGILDLTPERAAIVRRLEGSGVPVTAWLLLDVEDGYWLNADNAEQARARYRQTLAWAEQEGLRLQRIGLDIEFSRALGEEFDRDPRRAVWRAFRGRRPATRVMEAERRYADLVEEIRAGGRSVECYQFPQIIDERAAGSWLLRRTLGLVEVRADVEVLMLYASYLGRAGAHCYFPQAQAIAIGVTGGGVHAGKEEEQRRLLTWERLEEDLLAAARHSTDLYVFSLEGCVWRDFLPRLASIDWNGHGEEMPKKPSDLRAERRRRWLRRVLRAEPLADLLLPSTRRAD